jgi:hypothetical protein
MILLRMLWEPKEGILTRKRAAKLGKLVRKGSKVLGVTGQWVLLG